MSRPYDLATGESAHQRCARPGCGHLPDAHRLDDASNVSPADPKALFRCLGVGLGGCVSACPDFLPAVSGPERYAGPHPASPSQIDPGFCMCGLGVDAYIHTDSTRYVSTPLGKPK